MRNTIKRLLSKLPMRYQQELRRLYYTHQVTRGKFISDEPEFRKLPVWLHEGDWVLDIGANIGHYTCRLAELVGPAGHVVAFEPVTETFSLLASNVARLPGRNVTLLNVAASDGTHVLGMRMPVFETGLPNYYMARLTKAEGDFDVWCLPIDVLDIPSTVRLAKIDAEGHELPALRGMEALLRRNHPILIVEGTAPDVVAFLADIGYLPQRYGDSPNTVYFWKGDLSSSSSR